MSDSLQGAAMIVIPATRPGVAWLALRPDNAALAVGSAQDDVTVWGIAERKVLLELETESSRGVYNSRVSYTRDGRLVCSRGYSGFSVRATSGRALGAPPLPGDGLRYALHHAVSPDGKLLLVSTSDNRGSTLRLFRRPWQKEAKAVWTLPHAENLWFVRLAFTPAGDRFYAVERRRTGPTPADWLVLREVEGAELLADRKIGPTRTGTLCTTADGRAVATNGPTLTTWDGARDDVRLIRNGSRRHLAGAAAHPSAPLVAVAANDRGVRLYDANTLQVTRTYEWDIGPVSAVEFSPDGLLAAAGSSTGKLVVWDVDL